MVLSSCCCRPASSSRRAGVRAAFCTLPNTHSHSSDVWIRTEQNHMEVLVRCQPASLKVNELALGPWAASFTLSIGFLKCLHAFFASHRLFSQSSSAILQILPAALYFNPVPCCISAVHPSFPFSPREAVHGVQPPAQVCCRQTRRECVPSDEFTTVSLLRFYRPSLVS